MAKIKNQFNIKGLIERPNQKQWIRILLLSVIIGILGGFSAVILKYAIDLMFDFFFLILLPKFSYSIGDFNLGYLFLPILGASLTSPILSKWSKETQGGGVGNVLESVVFKRCNMKGRNWLFKLYGSSVTIGSGGSGGPEGPIIQMNASLGSFISDLFRLSPNEKRILVACGVGSGISAFFNAPLGGTIFSIELLVPSLEFFVTVPVFFAGIIGGVIGKLFIGPELSFLDNPSLLSYSYSEVLYFIILGIICGFLAYIWLEIFTYIQKKVIHLKIKHILKPILGAVPIGIILMLAPNRGLNGDGISYIDFDQLLMESWWILFLLGIGKMIITSITIGSGGSAGMFAPGLFIGSMFGGTFALIMNNLFPGSIENQYLYFVLGMGAFFAAASQEPIGILLIIAEMISNIVIIMPLMISITMAFVVNWMLTKGKLIYTINQEINNKPIRTDTITHFLTASIDEYARRDVEIVELNIEGYKTIKISETNEIPVYPVNQNNKLIGIIRTDDLKKIQAENFTIESIRPLIETDIVKVPPYTKILDAIDKMDEVQVDWLIVVHPANSDQFSGILLKKDISRFA